MTIHKCKCTYCGQEFEVNAPDHMAKSEVCHGIVCDDCYDAYLKERNGDENR